MFYVLSPLLVPKMYLYISNDQIVGQCYDPDNLPVGWEVLEYAEEAQLSDLFCQNGVILQRPDRPGDNFYWYVDQWVENTPQVAITVDSSNIRLVKAIVAVRAKPTVATSLLLTLALYSDLKGDGATESYLDKLEETLPFLPPTSSRASQ